jgi:hypothetical protein
MVPSVVPRGSTLEPGRLAAPRQPYEPFSGGWICRPAGGGTRQQSNRGDAGPNFWLLRQGAANLVGPDRAWLSARRQARTAASQRRHPVENGRFLPFSQPPRASWAANWPDAVCPFLGSSTRRRTCRWTPTPYVAVFVQSGGQVFGRPCSNYLRVYLPTFDALHSLEYSRSGVGRCRGFGRSIGQPARTGSLSRCWSNDVRHRRASKSRGKMNLGEVWGCMSGGARPRRKRTSASAIGPMSRRRRPRRDQRRSR